MSRAILLRAILGMLFFAPRVVAGPPIDAPPTPPAPAPALVAPADPSEKVPPPPPLLDAPAASMSTQSSTTSSSKTAPPLSTGALVPSAVAHQWEERIGLIGGLSGAALGLGAVLVLYAGAASQEGVTQDAQVGMGVLAGVLSLYGAGIGAYGGVIAGSAIGAVVDASTRPAP